MSYIILVSNRTIIANIYYIKALLRPPKTNFKKNANLNSSLWPSMNCVITDQNNHNDVIKWKHFPRHRPFVRGIHRSPVNSPHKGKWLGAFMFLWAAPWINGWVNNREAGDLRHHRAHYDVIAMMVFRLFGTKAENISVTIYQLEFLREWEIEMYYYCIIKNYIQVRIYCYWCMSGDVILSSWFRCIRFIWLIIIVFHWGRGSLSGMWNIRRNHVTGDSTKVFIVNTTNHHKSRMCFQCK